MIFVVSRQLQCDKGSFLLKVDNWDDFGFKTTFEGYYNDGNRIINLGIVKIAKLGMAEYEITSESIPQRFEKLPSDYYSLWQSAESYLSIKKIEQDFNVEVFNCLNDIAKDRSLYDRFKDEEACRASLFRFVDPLTCKNQFHRIANGEEEKINYNFSYVINNEYINERVRLSFDVKADSFPPSNVHVLIGRNGTGKTHLIKEMITSICEYDINNRFEYMMPLDDEDNGEFAGVLCVGFSPFDAFEDLNKYVDSKTPRYSYIGLKKEKGSNLSETTYEQFKESYINCCMDVTKRKELVEMIDILSGDPIFSSYRLKDRIERVAEGGPFGVEDMDEIFAKLSSGHKVVLSIVTCCVDRLAEKTILFMDEPENHLHPPLVGALIRTISKMLYKRNGVGIISTHSPVVLQEVPKECVWKLERNDDLLYAARPDMETFGANVGSLINEIFGYEVRKTGFYTILQEVVDKSNSYEEVLHRFEGKLGNEAKAIVRMMLSEKEY